MTYKICCIVCDARPALLTYSPPQLPPTLFLGCAAEARLLKMTART
jgi:hypothetical protein